MSRKRKKESEINESWLLPYSDMLTLLLALFIVLFASSEIDSQKYEELAKVFRSEFSAGSSGIINDDQGDEDITETNEEDGENTETEDEQEEKTGADDGDSKATKELQVIKQSIDQYIVENGLTEKFYTKLTGEGLMLTIVDDVFFDSGSATIKTEARETAKRVSQLLYSDPPHEVVISGHTDDVPIRNSPYDSNWELSVVRAVNFMTVVLENENLDPTLFSAKGYGEYKPTVPNTSEENRQKNRRVEILILPNKVTSP